MSKVAEDAKKTKVKIIKTVVLSVLITFVSLAIVGLQLFYPFHLFVGLGLYFLSFIPLIYRMYVSRKVWKKYKKSKYYNVTYDFIKKEKRILVIGIILLLVASTVFTLRPVGSDVFDISKDEIRELVTDDLYKSITAMDYLETSGTQLIDSLGVEEESTGNTEIIEERFNDFLTAVIYSESLTDTHKFFWDIPFSMRKERLTSFAISYSLYVKKYEIVHKVMREVSGSEYKKKVLNQNVELYDTDNIYSEMVNRFYAPKTHLRISGGRLYLAVFNMFTRDNYDNSNLVLQIKAKESYSYLFKHFDDTVIGSGEVVIDNVHNQMFDTWFPIQKNVANAMGHTIISKRGKDYFITKEQVEEMKLEMLPGDIMLQRRNWHLSNVGIPGFWTHSAMYTGSINVLDKYFESEFPFEGYSKFSEYIKDAFPDVYKGYNQKDGEGDDHSVIEAIEPGVVLQSLEHSAHADFVVVLRPNLNKKDVLLAILKSYSHFEKPYDYNFDFDTRDTLVCSELIYDSYFENLPEKGGLHFEISFVNGRKIVTPLNIAQKFKAEYGTSDAEFSFVYFLRGSEKDGKAYLSNEKSFLESVDWNKFSFLQD
ncbi:MAG: hypothetical protein ACI9GH_000313 [Candidatus Paceibacteria bacterium]|jgi:uncharacterized protein YycO